MNCEDFELYGSAYIDNMLSNEEKLEFENHIKKCEFCNVKFKNLKIIIESINEIEEVDLPISFSSELKAKLKTEKVYKTKNRIFNKKIFGAIVAGLLIIITSASVMNNSLINKNKNNLHSETDQMFESQENVTFDAALEESKVAPKEVPEKREEKITMQPRTMSIENTDEAQDSQIKLNNPSEKINNKKTINLFIGVPIIVGIGILIYKLLKK